MTKVLACDFETSSGDAKSTPITEIGARLVEGFGTRTPPLYTSLEHYSQLIYHPKYAPQLPKIVGITGITDEMLQADGVKPRAALPVLISMMEKCDVIMAHNAKFDRTVFESTCERMKIPFPKKRWLCSLTDVPWPEKYTCRKLSHLAFDHGLPMDGRELHRALNDVDLMLELVLGRYDIQELIVYADEPWVYLQAVIPAPWIDEGVGKKAAQEAGYSWERARGTDDPVFPKLWIKRVKERDLKPELSGRSFPVKRIN